MTDDQQFQVDEVVRYVVEGPVLALLQAEDGVGVALGTHPGECMVISGRSLKFIQRGPDAPAKTCPSCPHCGETFHVEAAKTHDLTVHPDATSAIRTLIAVENEADDYRLYLLTREAKLLGQILKALTPAQVAILADALTDGAL